MEQSSINGPFSMAMLNNQRAPILQIPIWQNKAFRDFLTSIGRAGCADDGLHSHLPTSSYARSCWMAGLETFHHQNY